MKLYKLQESQVLPISLEEAWAFFSTPKNLQKITPPELDFKITSDADEPIYPGMIITYRVKPMMALSMEWVTEITQVKAPDFFIDEQRFGPYKFWHHQHRFKAVDDGVEVEDIVHYGLPLGPLGQLAHGLFVKRQLQTIFAHRTRILEDLFGA